MFIMLMKKDIDVSTFTYSLVDFTGEFLHQVQIKHRFTPRTNSIYTLTFLIYQFRQAVFTYLMIQTCSSVKCGFYNGHRVGKS